MIKATFIIDITNVDLNYKEQTYNLSVSSNETYQISLRAMIDRAYATAYNKHRDFYKKRSFIYDGKCNPIYGTEEFRLLTQSVGGKDNLEIGKIVGARMPYEDIISLVFFVYE
jgi:hypothetical protein